MAKRESFDREPIAFPDDTSRPFAAMRTGRHHYGHRHGSAERPLLEPWDAA
jgi:hypothetical protein